MYVEWLYSLGTAPSSKKCGVAAVLRRIHVAAGLKRSDTFSRDGCHRG
jgi:hypothetical protein